MKQIKKKGFNPFQGLFNIAISSFERDDATEYVSIPFRDYLILQSIERVSEVYQDFSVSIPFRDYLILQFYPRHLMIRYLFVSIPFRDYLILQYLQLHILRPKFFVSIPFRDYLILQFAQHYDRYTSYCRFNPFQGLFNIAIHTIYELQKGEKFQSLSGII